MTTMTTPRNDDRTRVDDGQAALAADYPHFALGTKVRDCFGNAHVVREQVGCAVFVKGGRRFHPTKVFAVGEPLARE